VEAQPDGALSLRIGLNYAKGLRQSSAEALLNARGRDGAFTSVDDMALRVPELNRKELIALAGIGALNSLGGVEHRRDALWQVEQAARPMGPLLKSPATGHPGQSATSPLRSMTTDERIFADYSGTGLTTGPHPMAYHRAALSSAGVISASDLLIAKNHRTVSVAGCVIARQRPGTAKGFVFLSLEDETGIANIIITPDLFERERTGITRSRFLQITGPVQNQDGVVHVKAQQIAPLEITQAAIGSRDFH
jgi:error-prone DNA polymerase